MKLAIFRRRQVKSLIHSGLILQSHHDEIVVPAVYIGEGSLRYSSDYALSTPLLVKEYTECLEFLRRQFSRSLSGVRFLSSMFL